MKLLKRAKHYARTAAHIVKSTRQRKLLIRQKLIDHSDKMAPGLYIIGFRTAHRLFSPMPPTLKTTKTSRLAPQIYPIASRLVYAFDSRFPPNFHYISKSSPHSPDGDTTLFVSTLKNAKTFNLNKKTVTTYFKDEAPLLHLEKAYKALSPALPIPPQKFNHDQLFIEEPFINGIPFSSAPRELQIESYKTLLHHLIELSQNAAPEYPSEALAKSWLGTALNTHPPNSLKDEIENNSESLFKLFLAAPLTSSHGDLHEGNILLTADNLHIIDTEFYTKLPAFYDALMLPFREALQGRPLLLAHLRDGYFTDEWKALNNANKLAHDLRLLVLGFIILRIAQGPPHNTHFRELWTIANRLWFDMSLTKSKPAL